MSQDSRVNSDQRHRGGLATYDPVTDQLQWRPGRTLDPLEIYDGQQRGLRWNARSESFSAAWTPPLEDYILQFVSGIQEITGGAEIRSDDLAVMTAALEKQERNLERLKTLTRYGNMETEIALQQRWVAHIERRLAHGLQREPASEAVSSAPPAPSGQVFRDFQVGQVIQVKLYGACEIIRLGENALHVRQLEGNPGAHRLVRRRELMGLT